MKKAGAKNYKKYSLQILKVCKKKPISFEVFADNPKEMLKQAYIINKWGKNVYVKIPIENSRGQFTGSNHKIFKQSRHKTKYNGDILLNKQKKVLNVLIKKLNLLYQFLPAEWLIKVRTPFSV